MTRHTPAVHVTGVDFAAPMLAVGARKVGAAGLSDRVELVEGDERAFRSPTGCST